MVKWLNGYGATRILLFLTILLAPLYVVRFNIRQYPSTLLEVLIGLTVISWFVGKARQGRAATKLPVTSYQLPVALFLLAAAISVFVSPDKRGALGIFKAYFIEPILIYLVIKDVVKSKRGWWLVFGVLGLSGVWVAMLAVFQGLTGWLTFAPHEAVLGRAHGVYNTANAVGLYLGPIIFLVLGRFREFGRAGKIGAIGGILLTILAIVLSKSSGAVVGLVAGLGVLVLLKKKWLNCSMVKLLGLTALIIGVWFFFNISNFTPKNVDPYVRKSTDTLQFRLCLWEGARNLLLDRPVFGAGLSGFKELYSQKYFTCDAEPLEYPHNWILNFWTEMGILGLLGFLGILWRYFEKVKRVEKIKRGLGMAFAAAMVYWLVHGLVDVPYFKNDLSLEFWVIMGLVETSCKSLFSLQRSCFRPNPGPRS